jgi:hypothetical protein
MTFEEYDDVWRRYLAAGGLRCPACNATSVRRRYADVDRSRPDRPGESWGLVLPCRCGACGKEWEEQYSLESLELG